VFGLAGWITDLEVRATPCSSQTHPGHQNANEAAWRQAKVVSDLFNFARARGVNVVSTGDDFFAGQSRKLREDFVTTVHQGIEPGADEESSRAFLLSLASQQPLVKEGVWLYKKPSGRDELIKALRSYKTARNNR
jgi:hypothetical protein